MLSYTKDRILNLRRHEVPLGVTIFLGHGIQKGRVVAGDQAGIVRQPFRGEVVFLGQKVDRAQHSATGRKNWHVDARSKTQRSDQRMVKEIARKLWRGVRNKDLPPSDTLVIPTVPRDGFGARHGIFHRMRRIGAVGNKVGLVHHGDGEQARAKSRASLVEGGKGRKSLGCGMWHGGVFQLRGQGLR